MDGGKSQMRTERVDEVLLRNYLLGNLSDQDQAQVEDRAFADAGYLGALQAAEADLIDSYIRGELSQPDRRQFERRFLTSPQRRSKVEFARALARVAAEAKASQPLVPARLSGWQALLGMMRGWTPALQFAAGMAALVLLMGATWLMVQNAAMRSQVTALEAHRRELETRDQALRRQLSEEQARAANLAAQTQQPLSGGGEHPPLLASLLFLPGLSRAESRMQQLTLSSGTQLAQIEIQLEPRDDYPRFRAELHTRGGEEILTRASLPKRRTNAGYSVSFDVPASALAPGEYELALKGLSDGQATDVGYYYFRVQKQ